MATAADKHIESVTSGLTESVATGGIWQIGYA
jgi:hypothetical protein